MKLNNVIILLKYSIRINFTLIGIIFFNKMLKKKTINAKRKNICKIFLKKYGISVISNILKMNTSIKISIINNKNNADSNNIDFNLEIIGLLLNLV